MRSSFAPLRRSVDPGDAVEEVAAITEQLAVLLAAGVPQATAWEYLSATANDVIVTTAADAARSGDSVASAIIRSVRSGDPISAGAWRSLAAAWFVATESGAPLASSLRQLAASFRSVAEIQRELAVALAGPKSTARLVMFLPVVAVGLGALLGFDTVQTLLMTVPGLACLLAGSILMVVASLWNRRMVRAAQPADPSPGLALELMAIAMSGGGSVGRARMIVTGTVDRFAIADSGEAAIAGMLSLAQRAGVPAVELLRSEAASWRRRTRSEGQRAAAVLAVRLMIPLGLCVLPAFMLLGVAPVLVSVVSSTFSTLW